MASMIKQLKKSSSKSNMEQPHQCKYCNTRFHKESSLAKHQCVKKRRHMEANASGPRIGFSAFLKFHELTSSGRKQKTLEDFINSQFYIDFVKFGHHISTLKPVYPDLFIEYVIRNSIKLKDWTSERVYEAYIADLLKKEPAGGAVERSIDYIVKWTSENNTNFTDFFECVSPNEAAYMIKTGKISPWVLYLAKSGDTLMGQFTEDHSKMIGDIIDPTVWARKFRNNTDDVTYIQDLLDQAGL